MVKLVLLVKVSPSKSPSHGKTSYTLVPLMSNLGLPPGFVPFPPVIPQVAGPGVNSPVIPGGAFRPVAPSVIPVIPGNMRPPLAPFPGAFPGPPVIPGGILPGPMMPQGGMYPGGRVHIPGEDSSSGSESGLPDPIVLQQPGGMIPGPGEPAGYYPTRSHRTPSRSSSSNSDRTHRPTRHDSEPPAVTHDPSSAEAHGSAPAQPNIIINTGAPSQAPGVTHDGQAPTVTVLPAPSGYDGAVHHNQSHGSRRNERSSRDRFGTSGSSGNSLADLFFAGHGLVRNLARGVAVVPATAMARETMILKTMIDVGVDTA